MKDEVIESKELSCTAQPVFKGLQLDTLFFTLYKNSSVIIALADSQGNFVMSNPTFCRLTGSINGIVP